MPGGYRRLLGVRDLGSGMQLTWRPTLDETAETTAVVLDGLFREHGAPLVVKFDNGSAFRASASATAAGNGERSRVTLTPEGPLFQWLGRGRRQVDEGADGGGP